MGDVLWMTDEVRGWLAGRCTSDPPLARRAAQAILALLELGAGLGPPLVVPVPGFASAAAGPTSQADPDPGPALDDAYQRLLAGLTTVRRRIADVATSRKRIELQIDALPEGDARRAKLRAREAELASTEEKISVEGQRLQARVEAFRIGKEAATLPSGKPLTVRFELGMAGSPAVFQKGFWSRFGCVADVAKQ